MFFFFQAEDGIRDLTVTGVQTCALPICGLRHDDHRAHCELLRGIGDGLTMIAGGIRDDPALAGRLGEFADGVVGAADLERANRLLVLELEVDAELLHVDERRAARDAPQAGCGFLNVLGRDHAISWAWGLGPWPWAWPWPWPSAWESGSRRRHPPRRRRPRLPSRRAPRPPPGRPASGS